MLTFPEAQKIIAAITSNYEPGDIDANSVTQEDLDAYIHAAREAISPLDYDIRNTRHQISKQRVWALVNDHSDPTTQLATIHTPEEIAFIKRLLDAMFETYNTPRMEVMAITEDQAIKLGRPPRTHTPAANDDSSGTQANANKGLKHSEVLALLPSLVAEGWLEKSSDGFYSLAPRALLELRSWLTASYNDADAEDEWQRIKSCEACKEIVTVGQRCTERDCTARLHDICQEAYWKARREKKCPTCDREWTGKHFVGERAVTRTEAFRRGRRRGGGRRSDLVDAIMAQQDEAAEDQE
jgi:hypothetical protein